MFNFNTSLIQKARYALFSIVLAGSYQAIAQEVELDSASSLVFAPSKYPIAIRERPNIDSDAIVYLNSVDSVLLLEYTGGDYYKVCLPINRTKAGYVSLDYLTYDQTPVTRVNTYNQTHGKGRRLTYTSPPRGYEKQKTNKYTEAQLYNSNSSSPATRTIHTGPRGGRYYINKNGKKTYVKD